MRTPQRRALDEAASILRAAKVDEAPVRAVQLQPKGFVLQGLVAAALGYVTPLLTGLPGLPFLAAGIAAAAWVFWWREYSTLLTQLADGSNMLLHKGWPGGWQRRAVLARSVHWERPHHLTRRVAVVDGTRWPVLAKFDGELQRILGDPLRDST